jgi:hypothetical protein
LGGQQASAILERARKDGLRQASVELHFIDGRGKKLAGRSGASCMPKNGEEVLNAVGTPEVSDAKKALLLVS